MPLNSVPKAAKRLAISPRKAWLLVESGELEALKLGARTLISDAELDRFEASLPPAKPKGPAAPQVQQDDAALAA